MIMSSKTLCAMVRAAVIAVAVCGLATCGLILPSIIADIPWLLFLWAAAAPCFAILVLIWHVSTAIRQEKVFTVKTARLVKVASLLLFGDVIFFFMGNIIFVLLSMSEPTILLLSFFIDVIGVSLAVLAGVLSRYLTKAAALQEEADGTI
ncbi:MAG: DUF2975 domain-containing protein [Clostridia bacterium]|nr:DUF2975 domain-containing protein [Clostridia bacterium]